MLRANEIIMRTISEVASTRLWLSTLALKRALDKNISFDFAQAIRAGETLLVGEGNLSFSVALSYLVGHATANITATTLQPERQYLADTSTNAGILRKRGIRVISCVDATRLSTTFDTKKFQLIVFQFPNVGSRKPIYGRNPNHVLVLRFLRSASEQVALYGCIAITVVNSSHYDGAFDMDSAAERNGFEKPIAYPFYFANYPGYQHVKTKEDGHSAIDDGDQFVTYVFKKRL